MPMRLVLAMASLMCAAAVAAGDAPSDATPPQPAQETAPAPQRAELPALEGLARPVSFGGQADGAFPAEAAGSDSARSPDDAAREEGALNAPFWVFLLWYMGSR